MSERLETLKKARERMADDRDAFAKTLAAPFDPRNGVRDGLCWRDLAGRLVVLQARASDLWAIRVDRIAGVRTDHDITRRKHRQTQVAHALFGTHGDDDFAIDVEADAVAARVPRGRSQA